MGPPPPPPLPNLTFIPTPPTSPLLPLITRLESSTFPKSEALDIPSEARKRTSALYTCTTSSKSELYGYLLLLRTKSLNRIHKVCVAPQHRRKGIGKWMLQRVLEVLEKGGADEVDLWVDVGREAARGLYKECGFVEKETVEGYYGAGRDGVRMVRVLRG